MTNKPLIAIVGPTAVGKTQLSLDIGDKFPIEIISGDSMQIYKGLDIGTAKPSKEELNRVPHHMIDYISPDKNYSVGRFQREAKEVIKHIYQKNKIPMVVGGTGLYVNALIYEYSLNDLPKQSYIRKHLEERADSYGLSNLYQELKQVDYDSINKIHPNDRQRIIRALEVYHTTGEPISQKQKKQHTSPYQLLLYGFTRDRQELYNLIEKRVDQMISKGLVKEVEHLINQGYSLDSNAMQGLGYYQIGNYIKGEYSFDEAVQTLKRDTKRFAKRQLSWFRRDPNIMWFNLTNIESKQVSQKIIHHIKTTLQENIE